MGKEEAVYPPQEPVYPPQEPVTLSEQLVNMPIVDSMVELYDAAKMRPIVGVGLQLAGWSCATVAERINACCGDKVKAVNECAGSYVSSIKAQYPVLKEPTSEVVEYVVDKASQMAKNSACTILRSLPGRTALRGLDGCIAASAYLLDRFQSVAHKKRSPSPRKPPRFKELPGNGTSVPGEDRNTKTARANAGNKGILRQTTHKSGHGKIVKDLYLLVVVSPIRWTLKSMIKLRSFLHRVGGYKGRRSKSTGITPEKKTEIELRRKVSPRKRLSASLVGRIKRLGRRLLGLGSKAVSLTQADIRSYLYPYVELRDSEDAERKRKYEEIQTDQDSEDSLADFDIDTYKSDEDSDYEVPSGDSTDSLEYEAGDTESDLSFEHGEGKPRQIKEMSSSKQSHTSGRKTTKSQLVNQSSSAKITNGVKSKEMVPETRNGQSDSKTEQNSQQSSKNYNGSSSTSKGEEAKSELAKVNPTTGKVQTVGKSGGETNTAQKMGSGS